jgi:hypothetical protein
VIEIDDSGVTHRGQPFNPHHRRAPKVGWLLPGIADAQLVHRFLEQAFLADDQRMARVYQGKQQQRLAGVALQALTRILHKAVELRQVVYRPAFYA